MKHLWQVLFIALFLVVSAVTVNPSYAQTGSEIIVLDNNTPSVDMIVEIPAGTTGVVRLEILNAAVSVLNQDGQQVLAANSDAIRELEIQFGANSPAHSISIQRLANTSTAYLRVTASPTMSISSTRAAATAYSMPIETPQQSIPLDFSGSLGGVIEIQTLENYASSQLLDANATNILSLYSSSIPRLRVTLVGNTYQLAMSNLAGYSSLVTNVAASPLPDTSQWMQPVAVAQTTTATCSGTVNFEQVNQRSGPGVIYTITGNAALGSVLTVGGLDASQEWVLVATDYGSAWMAISYLDLAGECANLPRY